jgi:mTERF domain-containing protein
MFAFSLHKRIIPRASVLQYLLMKGLLKKNASIVTPFTYSEKLFFSKFVFSFKEESDYLLRLYQDNMKLAYTKEENNGKRFSK